MIKTESITPGKMKLRSVSDGSFVTHIDDGASNVSNAPSPGRSRIKAALSKKSKLDGKALFRVIEYVPAVGCEPVDIERCQWGSDDDARLIEHLEKRSQRITSSRRNKSQEKRQAEMAASRQAQQDLDDLRMAKLVAMAIEAREANKPAPKRSKSKGGDDD